MARTGWSASNRLQCASPIVTAVPATLSCWGNSSALGTFQQILGAYNSADDTNDLAIYLSNGSPAQVQAYTNANAAQTTTTTGANVWFHACGVFASATDRRAFLNGGGKGTEGTSATPAGLDRSTIGAHGGVTAGLNPFSGSLAEAAIWNIDLSDADVASLALGIHPFLIRPDKLVAYWPIIGTFSPEINLKSNTATMAIQGSLSQSAHTRVFNYPMRVPRGRPYSPPNTFTPFSQHGFSSVPRRRVRMIGV